MGRWGSRLYKTDRARDFDHEQDRSIRTAQIYNTIDRQNYQWIVVLVAGIGFFLDGYTLFASNIALPMIAYVFWTEETSPYRLTFINIATLAGTLVGQVLFGFLADRNGRKKMYGIELVLLIGSTLGVVMCSTGTHDSMSIFAWLLWWRIMVGVGVGADYPISAVITAEFAPTKHRARMMATVFFMQPLGQISGNLVSLIVVAASRSQGEADLIRTVDIMWRWVIGVGVVPGLVALLFRVAIPETPRFLLDIEDNPVKAEFDATNLWGVSPTSTELGDRTWDANPQVLPQATRSMDEDMITPATAWTNAGNSPTTLNSRWTLSKADIVQYFWEDGNWRTLAGTSLAWLLLDFGFYGIALSSPQFLAKTWGVLHITRPAPPWKTTESVDASIYDMFMNTSVHAMVILNTGSVAGGLLMILFASRLNRRSLQKYGFLALAALFIALGTLFITVHTEGALAIALYILGQALFNFGPNATTYIIPAEVFPTRYRGTCHGISAGAGKLGSILVQIFSAYYKFGSLSPGHQQARRYGTILIVFSIAMILGSVVTHFWVPDVQEKDSKYKLWNGKTRTLEDLAMGRRRRSRSQTSVPTKRPLSKWT